MEENKEMVVAEEKAVTGFENYRRNNNVDVQTMSNIKDSKKLFNLQSHVDCKLNDCVGESIKVKEVLIRTFDKDLEEPVIDETTGEIIKEKERKVSCILIDENGKSYATGSKMFTYNLISYLSDFGGVEELNKEGLSIKIIKVDTPSGNKALGFEIL